MPATWPEVQTEWHDGWEYVTQPNPAYQRPDGQPTQYPETVVEMTDDPVAVAALFEASYAVYPRRVPPGR